MSHIGFTIIAVSSPKSFLKYIVNSIYVDIMQLQIQITVRTFVSQVTLAEDRNTCPFLVFRILRAVSKTVSNKSRSYVPCLYFVLRTNVVDYEPIFRNIIKMELTSIQTESKDYSPSSGPTLNFVIFSCILITVKISEVFWEMKHFQSC